MKAHFTDGGKAVPVVHQLRAGRFHELPAGFRVLEFRRPKAWAYATAGMGHGLETFVLTPSPHPRAAEFLHALAHFHHTGARLGLGHTVNFGSPLWDGSALDHGFLSFPYLEPPDDGLATTVAWLIPITAAERDYKKEHGVEALETLFETHGLDYLNPSRGSLI